MKPTVRTFRKMKRDAEKITMITAFDASLARLAQAAGIDMILIGDSLGLGALGFPDTLPVTMDMMIHHSRAVRRGAPDTFIVGDMPFMSYNLGMEQALTNAWRLIQEAGCDAVKLETGLPEVPVIKRMVECGIPVMAHIGLLPQGIKTAGGYRVAGRSEDEARALKDLARAVEEAGAFSTVLECVPADLSAEITRSLAIPTIGIGAGAGCDGQVQVIADVLGLDDSFRPKHSKCYAEVGHAIKQAVADYVAEVKGGKFPTAANSF